MKRKITNIALLFALIIFPTVLRAQAPGVGDEAATSRLPNPQLEFIGQETYEVNNSKGTRYKLSVTNRASHPDFLWRPTQHLAPCGENENASRTWVEIFGSPGDKRLAGFCALRASEDLGHLWFPVASGEKGPPCVYIVMTDRQTGKKYTSNRACSRLFTVVKGSLKPGGKQEAGGFGWDSIAAYGPGNAAPDSRAPRLKAGAKQQAGGFGHDMISSSGSYNNAASDSRTPANKRAQAVQPDLIIKEFLFPPTNDKALRVHVVNTGKAPSAACRLVLTVREINGVAVGRKTHVNIPALAAGAEVWLHIDVKSILPVNVSLKSTTFKLNADATGLVVESNEANNEVWHNL